MHYFILNIDITQAKNTSVDFLKRSICLDIFYKLTTRKFRDQFEPDEYYELFDNLKQYCDSKFRYFNNNPFLILYIEIPEDFDFNSLLTNY